jgi:hypothetical protein
MSKFFFLNFMTLDFGLAWIGSNRLMLPSCQSEWLAIYKCFPQLWDNSCAFGFYIYDRNMYFLKQMAFLSITKETWVVEMRIWCIKIVNVLVLHAIHLGYSTNNSNTKICRWRNQFLRVDRAKFDAYRTQPFVIFCVLDRVLLELYLSVCIFQTQKTSVYVFALL